MLVILHSPKLVEVHLQLRLTLLSVVFMCDCEIDVSNRCIRLMSSALPQGRTPGIKLSVAINRLEFSVPIFNVIRGRTLEHNFNEGILSCFR